MMSSLREDVEGVFNELNAQKQRIWDMANDLFKTLLLAEEALKRHADTEGEVLALIETTLNKYAKKEQ
jgi:hypothetical protein